MSAAACRASVLGTLAWLSRGQLPFCEEGQAMMQNPSVGSESQWRDFGQNTTGKCLCDSSTTNRTMDFWCDDDGHAVFTSLMIPGNLSLAGCEGGNAARQVSACPYLCDCLGKKCCQPGERRMADRVVRLPREREEVRQAGAAEEGDPITMPYCAYGQAMMRKPSVGKDFILKALGPETRGKCLCSSNKVGTKKDFWCNSAGRASFTNFSIPGNLSLAGCTQPSRSDYSEKDAINDLGICAFLCDCQFNKCCMTGGSFLVDGVISNHPPMLWDHVFSMTVGACLALPLFGLGLCTYVKIRVPPAKKDAE